MDGRREPAAEVPEERELPQPRGSETEVPPGPRLLIRCRAIWRIRPGEQATIACLLLLVLLGQFYGWAARPSNFAPTSGTAAALHLEDSASRPVVARRPRFAVDLNTADWTEWMLLPRIGEARAQAIVQLREQQAGFADLSALTKVRGIGPRTLEQIRPWVVVRPPPP